MDTFNTKHTHISLWEGGRALGKLLNLEEGIVNTLKMFLSIRPFLKTDLLNTTDKTRDLGYSNNSTFVRQLHTRTLVII